MQNIAIITARGGSKRIPRKNIRSFLGKPIIAYGIKAAQEAGLFTEIMVSTDDEEIAEIALAAGASVPFIRSTATSDDYATTADVLTEVLQQYNEQQKSFDYTCCIYPTAAFVTGTKLKEAYALLTKGQYDSVFPLVQHGHSVLRSLTVENGKIKMAFPENENTRSQDLPAYYYDSGQFYWLHTAKFLQTHKIYTNNSGPFVVSEMEAHDIDTETDWKIAELKYQLLNG